MGLGHKKRVTCFLTWLEAFTAFQQLMVAIHGYDLYMSMANYSMKILDYERKYQWNAVYTLDIRHRADLLRKSVAFTNIDPSLPSSIFDSTMIKISAPRCSVCKSFLHTIAECPFSAVMGQASTWSSNLYNPKGNRNFNPNQSNSGKSVESEICNNFNNLKCNNISC